MRKKLCSLLLTISLVTTMFPTFALAAPDPRFGAADPIPAHEGCGVENAVSYAAGANAPAVIVTSFSELQAALRDLSVEDIVLRPANGAEVSWQVTGQLVIGRAVHISVAKGCQVTLKRGTGMNQALISVAAAGRLILGDGLMTQT